MNGRWIGTSPPRRTSAAIVSGAEAYVADHRVPGALWARVVRSYEAHAELLAVDAAEALALPGVVAVVTAADLDPVPLIPMRVYRTELAEHALQPVLADRRIRYVGEPIAVVVAEDPWVCEDAAELVVADTRELPAVAFAGRPAGIPLHAGIPDGVADRVAVRSGESVDVALAAAHTRIRREFSVGRQTACPMECRGLVAMPTAAGGVRVVGPTKVKHFHREALATMLDLDVAVVELEEPAVGGSFGARGEFYPEDLLIPWLALRLGAPVRWLEDRQEHFSATNHSREAHATVEIGLGADGSLLALRADVVCDLGAYVRTNGLTAGRALATHLAGPYEWGALHIDVRAVLTNKTPAGTYRAPGATEAAFFRERALEDAARAAGLDRFELRRRSLPSPAAMPFVSPGSEPGEPMVIESGDGPTMWDEAVAAATAAPPPVGDVLRGVGAAAFFVEEGYGPGDEARVRMDGAGFVVEVGAGAAGQGTETVLAQIAADALGVHLDAVRVEHRNLSDAPFNAGAFASRTTVFTGSAVAIAARDLRDRALHAAASRLGIPADELTLEPGRVIHRGTGRLIGSERLGVSGFGRFDRTVQSAALGAVVAVVDVDTGALAVRVRRLCGVFDIGRAVNPRLAEGQLLGAAMQGIGGALLEELRYDERAQPIQASFMDYRVPLSASLPEFDLRLVEHPAHSNPLGAKGGGELGITGVPAAIANAVADAIGAPIIRVPVTPEVLLAALPEAVSPRSAAAPAVTVVPPALQPAVVKARPRLRRLGLAVRGRRA